MTDPLTGQTARVEFFERPLHGDNVLAGHSGAGAAAHGENDAFAAGAFEHIEGGCADLFGCAADADFERVHVTHKTHAMAHALLHFANVLLLAPVQHVESGVGNVVQAGVHFGVV